MKILLATGIYPPDIGGPASYVEKLAHGFSEEGHDVTVITYLSPFIDHVSSLPFRITRVARGGGPLWTWLRYASALKKEGADADVIIAFSSISAGVPLCLSGLKKPKKILRLGGDFFWERHTGIGGTLSLNAWYESSKLRLTRILNTALMEGLLQSFNHIVYSTGYQQKLHHANYAHLPETSVIENAVQTAHPVLHTSHTPFRLLSLGRFVGFKNLQSLILAMRELKNCTLTITGEGPLKYELLKLTERERLTDRVRFLLPVFGEEKQKIFQDHDLFVIPSITEISPNAALEARSSGLPVLLTRQTGLSAHLTAGMTLDTLATPDDITKAVRTFITDYPSKASLAASALPARDWSQIIADWQKILLKRS